MIEPARADDLETLADWWVHLAREQRGHGSHVLAEPNRETIRDTLAAHRFGDGLLVARRGETLVGFASFSLERGSFALDADRALLSNLYVQPAYRGDGIGTALLEAAEDRLSEQGVEVVSLEAMADNEAARRFYRRHGYETHRVVMERSLADAENDTHSKEQE